MALGEGHVRHLLADYQAYYNGVRTHLALNKDAPLRRPPQTVGEYRINPMARRPPLSIHSDGVTVGTGLVALLRFRISGPLLVGSAAAVGLVTFQFLHPDWALGH